MMVVLVLSGACQDANRPAAVGQKITTSNAAADSTWWVATLMDAQRQYFDAVSQSCRAVGLIGYERCTKEKIIECFAMQGDAGAHCSMEDPAAIFIECVEQGTTVEWVYRALGLDPQDGMDWDAPRESLAKVSQLLAIRLTSKCLDATQRDCLAREIEYMFALDSREANRCVQSTDIASQVSCAIGLSIVEKYRSAVLYVG